MISDQLTRQGPLARVWLASHMEKKVSKSQFLQANIKKTIDAIETNQKEEPMTLRVSGQLLLGVVRIYSRKAIYLLDDCNDALVKIKLAFKKADVNMPDIHHSIASANTITLQDKLTDFDILLPDVTLDSFNEFDSIMENFDDVNSQEINLNEMERNFTFGDLEFGRRENFATEAGRRDQAGFAETAFEPGGIAEPFKGMSLNDPSGLANDMAGFDFDLNDNLDYGVDINEPGFNMPSFEAADASLDTLMQVGIMPVENNGIFDTESVHEPVVRKRKRLVVDKVTEIPQETLRDYNNNTSSIVNMDAQYFETRKEKTRFNLRGPSGERLSDDLETMFSNISRKRRTSASDAPMHNDHLGAPTPAADGLEPFGGFNDYDIDIDAGDFDRERFNQLQANDAENMSADNGSFSTENTQSLSQSTRKTFETIENHMQFNGSVKFAEIAPVSNRKTDAARRFYHVLLLASKDKIKVKQEKSFGDIQITTVSAH